MLLSAASLVLVGLGWTLTGAIMGDAPKKKIDPGVIQLLGAVFSSLFCLFLLDWTALGAIPAKVRQLAFLSYFFCGAFNCVMLYLMAYAMQRGPNGIVWAVIQSAMIFPFLLGVIVFGESPKPVRIAGLCAILFSLALTGAGRDNTGTGKAWKIPAFVAFLLTGLVHILATLPSFFESSRALPPPFRILATGAGVLLTSAVIIRSRRHDFSLKANLRSKYLWIYTGALQFFGLISACLLQYPAMDALARHGIGGASYPIMIASCLVGFSLFSIFCLKERLTPLQYAALGCCIAGIPLICL